MSLPPIEILLGVRGTKQALADLKKVASETAKTETTATKATKDGAKQRAGARSKESAEGVKKVKSVADAHAQAERKVTDTLKNEVNKRISILSKLSKAQAKASAAGKVTAGKGSGAGMAGAIGKGGLAALGVVGTAAAIGLPGRFVDALSTDQRARRIAANARTSYGDKGLTSTAVGSGAKALALQTGASFEDTLTALENSGTYAKSFDQQQQFAQAALEVQRVRGGDIGETSNLLAKAGKTFGISDPEQLRNFFLNNQTAGIDEEFLTFAKNSFGGGIEGLNSAGAMFRQLQSTAGGPGEAKQKFIQLSERLSEKDFTDKLSKQGISTTGKDGKALNTQQLIENLLVGTQGGNVDIMKKLGLDADMQTVLSGLGEAYRENYSRTNDVNAALDASRSAMQKLANGAYSAAEANAAVAEATNDAEANWNRAVTEFTTMMSNPALIAAVSDLASNLPALAQVVGETAKGIQKAMLFAGIIEPTKKQVDDAGARVRRAEDAVATANAEWVKDPTNVMKIDAAERARRERDSATEQFDLLREYYKAPEDRYNDPNKGTFDGIDMALAAGGGPTGLIGKGITALLQPAVNTAIGLSPNDALRDTGSGLVLQNMLGGTLSNASPQDIAANAEASKAAADLAAKLNMPASALEMLTKELSAAATAARELSEANPRKDGAPNSQR